MLSEIFELYSSCSSKVKLTISIYCKTFQTVSNLLELFKAKAYECLRFLLVYVIFVESSSLLSINELD